MKILSVWGILIVHSHLGFLLGITFCSLKNRGRRSPDGAYVQKGGGPLLGTCYPAQVLQPQAPCKVKLKAPWFLLPFLPSWLAFPILRSIPILHSLTLI